MKLPVIPNWLNVKRWYKQRQFIKGCDGCLSANHLDNSELEKIDHEFNENNYDTKYSFIIYKCETCGRYWSKESKPKHDYGMDIQWRCAGFFRRNIRKGGDS